MLRGNLVTEMSFVNDKLPHKAYYQGLLKRVTTTLRLISILSDEWFLHTSKESTVTNTVCRRITWIDWNLLASGKFMQFHLILWLYGGAFPIAYVEVYAIAIGFTIFNSQPACHNLVNDAII